MLTDSEASPFPETADSISRRSGLFSAQKLASASSLSKIGTSSHFAIALIQVSSCAMRLHLMLHQFPTLPQRQLPPLTDTEQTSNGRRHYPFGIGITLYGRF